MNARQDKKVLHESQVENNATLKFKNMHQQETVFVYFFLRIG